MEQQYDIRRPRQAVTRADNEKPAEKQVSVFGLKMSYSRAFGIAFLVLFVLLFFPGFGVSSAGVKDKKVAEQAKASLKGS